MGNPLALRAAAQSPTRMTHGSQHRDPKLPLCLYRRAGYWLCNFVGLAAGRGGNEHTICEHKFSWFGRDRAVIAYVSTTATDQTTTLPSR